MLNIFFQTLGKLFFRSLQKIYLHFLTIPVTARNRYQLFDLHGTFKSQNLCSSLFSVHDVFTKCNDRCTYRAILRILAFVLQLKFSLYSFKLTLNGNLLDLILVVSRMDSPLPSTLRELNHCIQKFNTKIISIMLSGQPDRLDEDQRLNVELDGFQRMLESLITAKNSELEQLQRTSIHNTSIHRERLRGICIFRDCCLSELENIKNEMGTQLHDEKMDIDGSHRQHSDPKRTVKRRNGRLSRSATCKRLHFVRSSDVLESSLNDDEIEMDLQYLWDQAKEMDVEVPDDFMSMNSKRPNVNERKLMLKKQRDRSIPSVATSDDDLKRIRSICRTLDIDLPDRALKVRLYGYGQSHLDVYRDIFEWVTAVDQKQHKQIVNELNSSKLRDIQVKLRSPGQVGRKSEIAKGIQQTLKTLTAKYKRNSD